MHPEEHLPLRPVELQVLACLAQENCHGYAIRKKLEAHGDGHVVPGLATLYRAILRLEGEALISRAEESTTAPVDERQRVYALTKLGRAVVAAEARRLAHWVDLVSQANP